MPQLPGFKGFTARYRGIDFQVSVGRRRGGFRGPVTRLARAVCAGISVGGSEDGWRLWEPGPGCGFRGKAPFATKPIRPARHPCATRIPRVQ